MEKSPINKLNNTTPNSDTVNSITQNAIHQQQFNQNDSINQIQGGSTSGSSHGLEGHDLINSATSVDDERIDYTEAWLKENQNSREILSRLNAVSEKLDLNKVQTGFVKENHEDYFNLDKKVQNQFLFDVLPSFEMYHSLQFTSPRDSFENPDHHDFPPDYFNYENNAQNCYPTSTNHSLIDRTPDAASLLTRADDLSTISSYAPTAITPSLSISRAPTPVTAAAATTPGGATSSPAPPDAYFDQDFEKNLIDRSHTLPNYDSFDIEVDVHITKDVPKPHEKPELESMLKEYTSGDVVHGYVVVNNTSNKPIHFQMFHVTLEGYVSIVDSENKKQILKRFLTMVDLSASWSYGCISPSANIKYEPFDIDHDGCVIGLRNDRILAPHTKYKKFFAFKFPTNLLDNICRHQQEVHTLLPPSLGIDRIKKKGKYSNIEVNPLLNYGHSGTRGSPILTKDLSQDKLSISYSINAKVIGTTPRRPDRLVILKDSEYALRFIPFGFGVPLFSSKASLDAMCQNIKHTYNMAERILKLNEGTQNKEVENFDSSLKARQLSLGSNHSYGYDTHDHGRFPLRNTKSFKGPRAETELKYFQKNPNARSNLFGKLKKSSKSTATSGNGLIIVSSNIPKDGLPYHCPKVLKQANEIKNLSEADVKNIDEMSSLLTSNEKRILRELDINIKFTPSDNSIDMPPPEIKSIKPTLVAMNIYSSASIPIKLSPDLFKSTDFVKLKSKFKSYYEAFAQLDEKFDEQLMDLSRHVDNSIIQDIKAMKDLQVEKIPLSVFEPVKYKSDWTKCSTKEWERSIQLKLNFKNGMVETLVPNFQSCLLSRIYCVNVDVVFENGQSCELVVPVRVRKFAHD